ncbi:hypothetical protein ACIOD1_22240 [Streptomyces sp. NPDC088097]|uniref:hypothetical protein n=1 Tax=Streptomyces sp. NPDC088097 TaxID=3365823 RepID=UPI00380F474A
MTTPTGRRPDRPDPHRVEFLRHPHADFPHLSAWGIRIDGTDLRVLVAEATRGLWALELDDGEPDEYDDTPQERDAFLLRQHAPLHLNDDDDGAAARAHFLGDARPELRHAESGALVLLSCSCGIDACWPLLATVTATAQTVTWSGFHQIHRPQWGELPLGPYTFARAPYEQTLAAPVHLPEDPLDPRPGSDQAGDTSRR